MCCYVICIVHTMCVVHMICLVHVIVIYVCSHDLCAVHMGYVGHREWTRRQGRPKTRWRDNLVRHLGTAWLRIARDRCLWKQFREGFLLTE